MTANKVKAYILKEEAERNNGVKRFDSYIPENNTYFRRFGVIPAMTIKFPDLLSIKAFELVNMGHRLGGSCWLSLIDILTYLKT
jgi:hypothetical protein